MQRKPQQHPALRQSEPHPFVGIGGDGIAARPRPLLKGGEDPFSCCGKVLPFDRNPALRLLAGRGEALDQRAEGAPLPLGLGGGNQQTHREIGTVVEKIVFRQCAMARGLDCQRRRNSGIVQADRLVDDIFIAALKAVVVQAQRPLEEAGQPVGGDRVGHDGRAGVLGREDGRHHRDNRVAVNLAAVGQHCGHPINVGVEDDSEIGVILHRRGPNRIHRRLVLGVWNMVGEIAVRLEKLAAGKFRSQRREHLPGKEAAGAVSRVEDDMQPGQRAVIVEGVDP